MNKKILLSLMLVALCGCRSNYDVTLSNGRKFSGVTKPILDKKTGEYRFKTIDGRVGVVHPDNVRLIEPHREAYVPDFGSPSPKK